jgi:hypothetical protein
MREDVEQEAELRRYLLGQLTQEEQVLIEQRLFLDSDYAQLAKGVEDDLIDDYVHDDLTEAEREEFGNRFLNRPEYSDDINIAQALDRYLDSEVQPAAGRPELRGEVREADATRGSPNDNHRVAVLPMDPKRRPVLWLAIAAGVLIILSAWIVFQSTRRPTGERFEAGGPTPAPTQSISPPQQPGPSQQTAGPGGTPQPNKTPSNERDKQQPERQSAPSFATVIVYPGAGTRGSGQTNEAKIPTGTTNLLMKIPVVTVRDYDKYHFELLSGGRALVVRNLNVSVDANLGRMVSLELPAKLFTQKNYEIRLRGLTTEGHSGESTTYAFTITK